jgi:hypothetical protein
MKMPIRRCERLIQSTTRIAQEINRFSFNQKLDRIDWTNARLRGIAHHAHAKRAASLCEAGAGASALISQNFRQARLTKKFSGRSNNRGLNDWKLIA